MHSTLNNKSEADGFQIQIMKGLLRFVEEIKRQKVM